MKISDFLIYILDNRDYFLGEQLENIQNKKDELEVLSNFMKHFMLEIQDSIDYDKSIEVLIDNQVVQFLIDELFEETDESIK